MTKTLALDQEYNDFIIHTDAGREMENPSDLRGTLLFLASSASNFVSGASVVVDGEMLGL